MYIVYLILVVGLGILLGFTVENTFRNIFIVCVSYGILWFIVSRYIEKYK